MVPRRCSALLLTVGALVVALGTGLDLALEVLARRLVGVWFCASGFATRVPWRSPDIPVAEADRFLSALADASPARVASTQTDDLDVAEAPT